MRVKKFFKGQIWLILFIFSILEAKPPSLTPRDTKTKIHEILKSHVTYKDLSPEIIKRTLQNYLEELDPMKTYFIENEAVKWSSLSQEELRGILSDIEKEQFKAFSEIYKTMLAAIQRRNALEEKLAAVPLPENVQASEFKDLKWTSSSEELLDRLLKIRSLQIETAGKLEDQTKEQFMQRIAKRRIGKEQEIQGGSEDERQRLMLALVLKSITAALDAHTAYFTPSEANQFMIQVQQRLFGIGAQLRDDLNGFTVVRILEGSPAMLNNKLKTGDKIIAVNREPVVGMDIFEVVDLIRGPKGSPVHLTVLRENEEEVKHSEKLDIEIIRDEIVLKETRFESECEPFGDGVIAYLKLYSFYQDPNSSSAGDLKDALEKIKKENKLLGVMLDLRNNAGGLLPQAVNVAGMFVSKGVIVSIKDSGGKIQHLRNSNQDPVWNGPLVILINRASASAAEIVAQSLQDYGRALIVGDESSFGKGTYQTFTLESANQSKINPQGEYKVTRGMYFTVSGKSPQLLGTKADVVVPGILSEMEIGEKFAKFPLENDQILPNFEDQLADIHPIHRPKMRRMYKQGKQEKLDLYAAYLTKLKKNSQHRIETNSNYQNFLKEIRKKDHSDNLEVFGQNDLQLEEGMNVLKDLIFLLREAPPEETPQAG